MIVLNSGYPCRVSITYPARPKVIRNNMMSMAKSYCHNLRCIVAFNLYVFLNRARLKDLVASPVVRETAGLAMIAKSKQLLIRLQVALRTNPYGWP